MCGTKEKSVNHLKCSQLAQSELHKRLDNVARIIHWKLSKVNGIPKCEIKKWYKPESVTDAKETTKKLLWDLTIQADQETQARRLSIVVLDRNKN